MKKLYLVRGLPGSGKSTFAQTLAHALLCPHVEADFYFERTGTYKWVAEEVRFAHKWCQEKTEHYLRAGEDVVVSNTFTTEKELEWYVDKGREYGYFITVLVAENRHGSRSVHDVPETTMEKMRRRFSIKL